MHSLFSLAFYFHGNLKFFFLDISEIKAHILFFKLKICTDMFKSIQADFFYHIRIIIKVII